MKTPEKSKKITADDLARAERALRDLGRGALAHVRGAGDSESLKYKYKY